MPIRSRENLIGAWAFLAGIVIALVAGVFLKSITNPITIWILAGLGIVVGYFVTEKDVQTFLLASVSVVIVSYAAMSGLLTDAAMRSINIGKMAFSVLSAFVVLFTPAAIVVAIKTVFSLAKR